MKKDVMVSFKSFNEYEEDNTEKIEFITKGTFFEKDGKCYIKYEEKNENESVITTLKTDGEKVTILRYGANNTQMIIEKGKKHLNYYETPHGAFTVGTYAREVDVNISENCGSVRMSYNIELNNVLTCKNQVEVDFKEV